MKLYLWQTKRITGETFTDKSEVFSVEAQDIRASFGERQSESHKGSYGTVLIFGGSRTMEGAVHLAALGALRSGAGRVIAAVPQSSEIRYSINSEIMVTKLEDNGSGVFNDFSIAQGLELLNRSDVVVIGPGFGRMHESDAFFGEIIRNFKGPILVDADGLYHLKYFMDNPLWENVSKVWNGVITPHAGEAAFLIDSETEYVNNYKFEALEQLIDFCKCTVVLKGNNTLVSKDGEKVFLNETGNPGMATAGSGDVLSGIISAVLAKKDVEISTVEAAAFGVWIHGLSGDLAANDLGQTGMIAGDILKFLPYAWKETLKF